MSLCDKCHAPGACCRSMMINGGGMNCANMGPVEALDVAEGHGLPFYPHKPVSPTWPEEDMSILWVWRFACRNLLPNGRCGDYENRPGLCRRFEPASDALCVHYRGQDAGDASAGETPHTPIMPELATRGIGV